jgi:alcohol dehydrogenase
MAPGAVGELANELKKINSQRVLLVSDPGLVQTGLLEPILAQLSEAGLAPSLYSDVQADPPDHVVMAAAAAARAHKADTIVGIGGGSSMDTAKLIAVLAGSEQSLEAMYGVDLVQGPRLPLLQIPTTAGTGSEVTPISIVTTGETTKSGVVSSVLLADTVILDPELTVGLPPAVTAATGIDAMVHAIEAYTSAHKKNPVSDALAREALRLLSKSIHQAVRHGDDLDARSDMLLGAMLAGQAFANAPVAAVHALAYPLGGHYHIPHGLSNSLVLPHVLRFNAPAANARYAELLPIMGIASSKDAGAALADYSLQLAEDLGLPITLKAMDIKEDALAMLADDAMLQQRLLVNNPREVNREDALDIYTAAFQ